MNYYKHGDAANANKIRATFEKLGYDTSFVQKLSASDSHILFTLPCDTRVHAFHTAYIEADILKRLVNIDPDYKELELPVEPKFKVGDWIANDYCAGKVIALTDDAYLLDSGQGIPFSCEHNAHLWTIQDAKDGDVLATGNIICIFKKLDKDGYYIISPCIYTVKDGLEIISDENDTIGLCGFKPATKEDRELLFRKIKEAGYRWDADKKELKKFPKHYDITNFHAGMPVLVRDSDGYKWLYTIFGIYNKDNSLYPFVVVNMRGYEQCIPFNEETKHLLGTTDMPSEEYINWKD